MLRCERAARRPATRGGARVTELVKVRGLGTALAEPDAHEVEIEIAVLRRTREEALAEVEHRARVLAELLLSLDIPAEWLSMGGVSVREERDVVDGTPRHRGYRGSSLTTVRLSDASIADKLIRLAAEEARARVSGPRRLIGSDNDAFVDACSRAAADARRKAQAYAEAMGARLGAILEIVEPGAGEAAELSASTTSDGEVGPLEVRATVDVTFELEQ